MIDYCQVQPACDLSIKCSDDEIVYYSRYLLTITSPVFEAMFTDRSGVTFKEAVSNEITVGVTSDIFNYVLNLNTDGARGLKFVAYLKYKDIAYDFVGDVIECAKMYSMNLVLELLELILVKNIHNVYTYPDKIMIINFMLSYELAKTEIEKIILSNSKALLTKKNYLLTSVHTFKLIDLANFIKYAAKWLNHKDNMIHAHEIHETFKLKLDQIDTLCCSKKRNTKQRMIDLLKLCPDDKLVRDCLTIILSKIFTAS